MTGTQVCPFRSIWPILLIDELEPVHTALRPHENGIFDVKWNMSDTLLATGSGDRSTQVSDLETCTTIYSLRGHEGTVKCISWDPSHPDLLSTGGRDGLICIWDLRVSEHRLGQGLLPVLNISAAHEDVGANGKRKTSKGKNAPMPKSVTGLLVSDANPYHLISSGSNDGFVFQLGLPFESDLVLQNSSVLGCPGLKKNQVVQS